MSWKNYSRDRDPPPRFVAPRAGSSKEFSPLFDPISDPENIALIKRLLAQKSIKSSSYKEKYLIRRIRVRMSRLGLKTYKEYFEVLKSSPEEFRTFVDSMSINVTRFFRNRDTFEYLEYEILPGVLKQFVHDNPNKAFKIWVAGTSLGAEAYTYAILMERLAKRVVRNLKYLIIATDINTININFAQRGVFSEELLEELESNEVKEYFIPTLNGEYKIKPHLQRNVRFETHDLLANPYYKNVNLISCRNVLIYISKEEQERIIRGFINSLDDDGILVLGRTESVFGNIRSNLHPLDLRHRIYQKKSGRTATTVPTMQTGQARLRRKTSPYAKDSKAFQFSDATKPGTSIKEIIERLRRANEESRKRYSRSRYNPRKY